MSWESVPWIDIAKALSILVPGVVTVAGLVRGPGAKRESVREDAQTLALLPADSKSYAAMERWLEEQIEFLRTFEKDASRDWPMFAVSVVAAPALAYATIELAVAGQWWQYVLAATTGMLAIVFVYGIFECAERVPRDKDRKRTQAAVTE